MSSASDTLTVRVARKTHETADICRFELVPQMGASLPAFTAGAHIDVHVPDGPLRQYSLCNSPGETHRYEIGVLRAVSSRGGSSTLHARVKEGDVLTISSPRNHFPLRTAAHTLLVAGGIGVTPMLSMIEHLAKSGANFMLHYCATQKDRMAFLQTLSAPGFRDKVLLHLDDGALDQRLDVDTALLPKHNDARLYVCGPHGFMQWITGAALERGWASERIHTEAFGPLPTASSCSGAFEVILKRTGDIYVIPPERSVASVLVEAGVDIALSCEAGICGTCVTSVLEGTPDHRDSFLTDEERGKNDRFTPCCSRACSTRLVIDL
ncbi:PDR/VanB family oxidoreductase [Rhodoferax sp.]|uniref:PDR/VanB family oxidoreductase n=1 Tax=Rhodoferax sp. TaxID=50421 RepID=UPI002846D1EA|nr:PDR/VanB family oxidoreductase [Rhodoferax sp.]MDR3367566.1 PDR/VanB family oxidoreductase [Rhodoferax sp.]